MGRKGRSAGGGEIGKERQGEMWGTGRPVRGPKTRTQGEKWKTWATVAGGEEDLLDSWGAWGEQWSKEGIKWKRDRKSQWPLRLFKFVVLIDNVFHFFCVWGGYDSAQI